MSIKPVAIDSAADALSVQGDADRAKLDLAVRRAATDRKPSMIMVHNAKSKRRVLMVSPASRRGEAFVTYVDLDAGLSHLCVDDIIELFSISPAEAETALLLTRGASLAEAAARRGVRLETVRTQFKAAIRKVGVANQKQLATVLTQVAAALLQPPSTFVAVRGGSAPNA